MGKFLLIPLLLISSIKLYATHAAGMDIAYECINSGSSSDTYKITLKFYRDCEGISNWGTLYLDYTSSCGSGSAALNQIGSAVNINPACLSFCNGGNSLGIEQYTYEATITLSHCSDWVLSVCEAARNNAINTINNPGGQDLCVQATLSNTVYCNNSPTFSQNPTPFVCAGNYYCYNNGAIETDGDSLVYSLITPLNTNNGGTVTYIPPYNSTNPVGGGSTFDPTTGNLCITPPNILTGILAIKISEYRNGILIGSIIRDIQINSFSCTGTVPPALTGINLTTIVDINNTNSYTYELNCPNGSQNIIFDINTINNNPTPPPGSQITVTVGGGSWQSEVSWEIYDPSGVGTIIASGGAPFSGTVCVPNSNLGSLQFIMYDSWGDGWNGNTYTLSGNNTLSGQTTGTLTSGSGPQANTFNVNGGTPCTNGGGAVSMSWNNGIPAANFTITNNNSMNPVGTFNWTPNLSDTTGSPYFFTVNISDDACPVQGNFSFQYQVILNGSDITISPTITNPSCSGLNNGAINTLITSSNPPYTYSWSNGQSTQNISNLAAGSYNVIITDALGCNTNETYTLIDPAPFSPTINQTNISCYGANNGVLEVINEPITTSYLWSNNYTTSSISNLSAGFYSVDVSDINGCISTQFFNIIEPSQIIVISSYNDISCYGANDGNINLTISGGAANYTVDIPPYSQVLSNGAANYYSQSILSAGIYNYTITDANNCTVSDLITINEPSQLTASPLISNVLCKDESNGSIVLNTTGGTAPYNEILTGNSNPLQLPAGTYIYTITDHNGCYVSDTFNISEPDSLLSSATSTDATCAGYSDGSASLSITGGTNPYNTNWNGSNPNGLNAGSHNYIIIDYNGCISQGSVTINEPLGMQLIIDTFRVSCYGGADGSAILNISGGAGAPYNTNWGGLNSNALTAGNHIVTVSDINNCSLTDTAFITQPSDIQTNPLITNINCFGNINGNAILQLSGGIPPYNQTWFGVDSSYLAPGTYPYQVTDANNCVKNGNVTIYEPDPLIVEATIVDVNCYGDNNGSINLDITGGTAPYTTDFGIFNQYLLAAGTYAFTITDANGCTFDSSSTINQANEIFLDFIATSPICRYDESKLLINISNSLSNTYTVSLLDSILKSFVIDTNGLLIPEGVPITLTPNFSGEVYIVSLTDNEGCTREFNDDVYIEVKQLPQLAINEDDICVGELSYTLNNATPIGGAYFINNIMTDYFDVENLQTGSYNIRYEYTDPVTSCYNEVTEVITISESPEAGMLFSPQPTDIDDPNILFRDNSNEEVYFPEWHLGDGTIIYDELSFWHTYADTGTYTIKYYITNIYGCTDSVINQLTINPICTVFIPDAFTPNSDGDNDYFYPSIIGENTYNMKVYDRWGEIIYNEDNGQWDGKVNNNDIVDGVYTYSISVFDFNNRLFIYSGILNLIK